MTGDLYINGFDAYEKWGISLQDTGMSALMTPVPNKPLVESKSRLKHGKRIVIENVRKDERSIVIPFKLRAKNKREFLTRYASFCDELGKGILEIRTCYMPDVVYRCVYESCNQFAEFMMGLAKFTLKVTEPDPTDRSI